MIWLATALASPLVFPDGADAQLADVDGDGHVDVVLNAGEAVHFNDGAGGFGPLTPLTADPDAEGTVVYTDLDGDGRPEACREQAFRVDCHEGIGRGLGPVMATVAERPFAIAAVDADGDGDPDLVVSTIDGIVVADNDGTGVLTPGPPQSFRISDTFVETDVDGDGDLDLVGVRLNNDHAQWMRRDDVTGALGPPELLLPANASSVAFVDLTADGVPDLLTQSYSSPIYARERQPDESYGAIQPLGAHTGPFALAPLDPAAGPGLLVCDDDELRWDAGIDGGYVTLWDAIEPTDRLCRTPVSDVDGDGAPDVLTATTDLTLTLDPLGARATTTLQRSSSAMGPVATGDLDGDGWSDLVYTSQLHDELWAVRGAGGGAVHPVETLLPATSRLTDLAVLDLSGDGLADIAMTDTGGNIALLVGLGGGAFGPPVVVGGGAQGEGVAIDADQDGVLEWVVPTGAGLTVLDDDGTGGTLGTIVAIGPTDAAAAGDTDGDGLPDLVALADELVVLRSGPTGLTEALRGPAPGRAPSELLLLDADGDGRDHLVVRGACELGPNPYYGGTMCITDDRLYALEEVGGTLAFLGQVAEVDGPMTAIDWDGDGAEEVLTTQDGPLVRLDGSYVATPFEGRWPAVDLIPVDFDGDQDVDVVNVQAGGMWAVWNGDLAPAPVDTSATGHTGDTGTARSPMAATADTGGVVPTTDPPGDKGTPPDGDPDGVEEDAGCRCAQARPTTWGWLGRRR